MKFKVGDVIEIVYMKQVPGYAGKIGVIQHIDDKGQLHGTWGGLAAIPKCDQIRIIKSAPNSLF